MSGVTCRKEVSSLERGITEKQCRDYGRTKSVSDFWRRKASSDGYAPGCDEVLAVEEFVRNKTESSGCRNYCKTCHDTIGRNTKERLYGARRYHLKRRYGLTAAAVKALKRQQGGLCPICLSAPAEHVDHDHATGAVRAVLCFNCNGGLGQFKDDPGVLRRAAKYVEGEVWTPILVAPGVYRLPS